MPAEIDTLQLLNHIDTKFGEADRKRSESTKALHAKIDAFRGETTAAFGKLSTKVELNEQRIDSIEERETTAASKSEGRMLAAAKILLSGGGLAAAFELLRGRLER